MLIYSHAWHHPQKRVVKNSDLRTRPVSLLIGSMGTGSSFCDVLMVNRGDRLMWNIRGRRSEVPGLLAVPLESPGSEVPGLLAVPLESPGLLAVPLGFFGITK